MQVKTKENGSRCYKTETGTYPSVTTILTATASEAERAKLQRWMQKQNQVKGWGAAHQYCSNRAQEGKDIHAEIAAYLEGKHSDLPDSPFTNKAHSMLRLFKQSHCGVEQFISHPHPKGYAGTLDLVTPYDTELTVFDWTTSKRPKIKQWLNQKFLQCTAYAIAYGKTNCKTPTQVGVIVLTPTGLQLFTDSPKEYEKEWRDRLHRFYTEELWHELGLEIS